MIESITEDVLPGTDLNIYKWETEQGFTTMIIYSKQVNHAIPFETVK